MHTYQTKQKKKQRIIPLYNTSYLNKNYTINVKPITECGFRISILGVLFFVNILAYIQILVARDSIKM